MTRNLNQWASAMAFAILLFCGPGMVVRGARVASRVLRHSARPATTTGRQETACSALDGSPRLARPPRQRLRLP